VYNTISQIVQRRKLDIVLIKAMGPSSSIGYFSDTAWLSSWARIDMDTLNQIKGTIYQFYKDTKSSLNAPFNLIGKNYALLKGKILHDCKMLS
jgi:hypothetical protein